LLLFSYTSVLRVQLFFEREFSRLARCIQPFYQPFDQAVDNELATYLIECESSATRLKLPAGDAMFAAIVAALSHDLSEKFYRRVETLYIGLWSNIPGGKSYPNYRAIRGQK
jgi:hypothetical protein